MRRSSVLRGAPVPFAVCAAVGLLAASPGRAAGPPVVVWDAPASCPDGGALQAELARRIGDGAAARISEIRVRAAPQAGGWNLVVALVEDGLVRERSLTAESCEAAIQAAVFVVTLAIEAGRAQPSISVPPPPTLPDEAGPGEAALPSEPPVSEPPPTERPGPAAPAASVEDTPVPQTEPAAPVVPSRRRRALPQALVHAGLGLHAGLLPVGVGLVAGTGVQWPRVHVLLGYTRFPPVAVRLPDRPDIGGDLSVHAGTLRAGPVLRIRRIELPLHAGVELGGLRAVGVGADVNFTRTTLWAAAFAGVGVGWAPGKRGIFALRVVVEVAAALRRPSLAIDAVEVGRIGPAGFRGLMMVEVRLPSLARVGTGVGTGG